MADPKNIDAMTKMGVDDGLPTEVAREFAEALDDARLVATEPSKLDQDD